MDDEITLSFDQRHYRIRGIRGHWFKTMRVHIKAECSDGCFIDVVDLYASRPRDKFIKECSKRLKVEEGLISKDIYSIIKKIEQINKNILDNISDDKKELTDQERNDALTYLQSPNLLERITQDMETLGFVGEELNKRVGFLIAISRKLDKPLSGIIISSSAAGKSYLIDILEKMTPSEDVIFFSRITPQALFYMEKDFLKHKLVIIEERNGSKPADYPIRSLQSKGKLVLALPVKDKATKIMKTITITVEGPIAYLETTTDCNINYENATRCFELYLDESQEQTKRIHHAQRGLKTFEGLMRQAGVEGLSLKHQNIQRLLRPVKIINPYAHCLRFPPKFLRTRRDNLRFLNLIEVITFLYQYQRPKKRYNALEYIESAAEDYELAYNLGRQLFSQSLDELSRCSRRLFEYIERMSDKHEISFTRRQLVEYTGLSHYQVKAHIKQLEEFGYIEPIRKIIGERFLYRYRPHPNGPDPLRCLITPNKLKRVEEVADIGLHPVKAL